LAPVCPTFSGGLALSSAEFGKLIADETEKWGKVIRAATPGRPGLAMFAPGHVAFHLIHGVGTQDETLFAAQWLAYALPCQRFAEALAGHCA